MTTAIREDGGGGSSSDMTLKERGAQKSREIAGRAARGMDNFFA